LQKAKVRVPEPIKFHQNLLLMEYIGTEQMPAPMLRNVLLDDPEKTYKTILKYIKLAYQKAELVHGDLSEYNVLMEEAGPVIIDVGQALTVDHPNAGEYLKRDIENINRYFRSLDVKIKPTDEIMIQVKKKKGEKK
jgi:RIO kinase 1